MHLRHLVSHHGVLGANNDALLASIREVWRKSSTSVIYLVASNPCD